MYNHHKLITIGETWKCNIFINCTSEYDVEKGQKITLFFCNFLKNALIWNLNIVFWCKIKFQGHLLNSILMIEGRLHVKKSKYSYEDDFWSLILSSRVAFKFHFTNRKHFLDFRSIFWHFCRFYMKTTSDPKIEVQEVTLHQKNIFQI